MRFIEQMKQSEIAEVLGVSQVQVSRLLRSTLERLRLLVEHRSRRADGPTDVRPLQLQ